MVLVSFLLTVILFQGSSCILWTGILCTRLSMSHALALMIGFVSKSTIRNKELNVLLSVVHLTREFAHILWYDLMPWLRYACISCTYEFVC